MAHHEIVANIHHLYEKSRFKIPMDRWTVLAAFTLSKGSTIKTISLATGSRCLPAEYLESSGDLLFDSHAEVLSRRGAVRWCMEEAERLSSGSFSEWLCGDMSGIIALQADVQVHMYVSTLPCGDASTGALASVQDPAMAALKNGSTWQPLAPGTAARGRDNYALLGVLRTKPGRADSPPTRSMSCSDKIALWNVVGIQGALGATIFSPIYISNMIIGGVSSVDQASVMQDCERALWGRLQDISDLCSPYQLRKPTIHFTSVPFIDAKSDVLQKGHVESLIWIADRVGHEILINGRKRGISPKIQHLPKYRPMISKIAMLELYTRCWLRSGPGASGGKQTYREVKCTATRYQAIKSVLRSPGWPFHGWIISGEEVDGFTLVSP